MADNNYLDQNGVLYLWQKIVAKITNMIVNKVDKVDGKGLSTNDYTTAEKTKLAGIATNANNYSHPTSSGNKHIPSGGSSGQILRWSANGTAVWGSDNNTTYAAKQTDMNKAIVNISASGTTLTVTKADGTTKYVTAELVKGQMIYCCSNSEDQIYCC